MFVAPAVMELFHLACSLGDICEFFNGVIFDIFYDKQDQILTLDFSVKFKLYWYNCDSFLRTRRKSKSEPPPPPTPLLSLEGRFPFDRQLCQITKLL